jgi:hypothetical protein
MAPSPAGRVAAICLLVVRQGSSGSAMTAVSSATWGLSPFL